MTQDRAKREAQPTFSFGLPVRNGEPFLRRALESLETQDLEDFEVIVVDNQSTDRTPEIVKEFTSRDPRFKYYSNETNIGQIANFNRAFELSEGRYFRWVGSDDQLEPSCASHCVAALDANPDAVGVFSFWRYADDEGNEEIMAYKGHPVRSKRMLHRMASMMWALQSPGIDPMYSTFRRSMLEQTGLVPISVWNDRVLPLDSAMVGPFCHVDECLSTRRHSTATAKECVAEYHPSISAEQATNERMAPRWTMYRDMSKVVLHSSRDPAERILGTALVASFGVLHYARALGRRTRRLVKR